MIFGKAQPKGSARGFALPAKEPGAKPRVIITSTNRNLKQWEQLVAGAAQRAAAGVFFTGPVVLELTFWLPRPKSIGAKNVHHLTKPDCSKLIRSTEDALKTIVWGDDAQVTDIVARKRYAAFGATPCVEVKVTEACAEQLAPMPMPLFREEVSA